jgi:hypothetical protein
MTDRWLVRLLVLFAFGLSAGLMPEGASAQSLEFDEYTVEAETATWMGFALSDLNGDGLRDVMVQNGGDGGPLLWYEASDGGTAWTRHVVAETPPNGPRFTTGDLEVGDIDGDGDVDVLGFEHPGEWRTIDGANGSFHPTTVYWYENDGSDGGWTPHRIGTMPDFVKDVEIEDYDGDGRPDLAMITYKNEHAFSIFRQEEDGSFTRVQLASIPGMHEGMDSGDFDGDGDIGIAANGYWLENPDGALTDVWIARSIDARWHTQTGGWRHNATKVKAADLTGDGTDEVIISHSESSGYPITWYEPTDPTSPEGWTPHVIGQGLNAVHTLEAGDFNGDGALDVLAGENGDSHTAQISDDGEKQVRIFLNDGDAEDWTPVVFSNEGLYNGRVADIDGDGTPDVAGPNGHEGDPYTVYLTQ